MSINPVADPDDAPAAMASSNAIQCEVPVIIAAAVTAAPRVKLPSVVISGMLKMRSVIKMPKARGTKSKSRIQAFHETEEKIKTNKTEQKIDLSVKTNRLGSKILELTAIKKSFGEKIIINKFSYTFKHGDKIGLVGKNGIGKSTLLNLIMFTSFCTD